MDMKIQLKKEDIFNDFKQFFTNEDMESALQQIAYPQNREYEKNIILSYWRELVETNDENESDGPSEDVAPEV